MGQIITYSEDYLEDDVYITESDIEDILFVIFKNKPLTSLKNLYIDFFRRHNSINKLLKEIIRNPYTSSPGFTTRLFKLDKFKPYEKLYKSYLRKYHINTGKTYSEETLAKYRKNFMKKNPKIFLFFSLYEDTLIEFKDLVKLQPWCFHEDTRANEYGVVAGDLYFKISKRVHDYFYWYSQTQNISKFEFLFMGWTEKTFFEEANKINKKVRVKTLKQPSLRNTFLKRLIAQNSPNILLLNFTDLRKYKRVFSVYNREKTKLIKKKLLS